MCYWFNCWCCFRKLSYEENAFGFASKKNYWHSIIYYSSKNDIRFTKIIVLFFFLRLRFTAFKSILGKVNYIVNKLNIWEKVIEENILRKKILT